MKEKERKQEKQATGGSPDGIFSGVPDPTVNLNVHVSSGPYAEELPVAGTSVSGVRQKFADRFDIDPQSQAIVNGKRAGEDYILKAGESLMFVRHAGEKG